MDQAEEVRTSTHPVAFCGMLRLSLRWLLFTAAKIVGHKYHCTEKHKMKKVF